MLIFPHELESRRVCRLFLIVFLFFILLLSNDLLGKDQDVIASEPLSPIGEQKTLVVLFNFQDDSQNKPYTKEEIDLLMFAETSPSVNAYYRENSFNKTWFAGEVVGWFTIPYDGQTNCPIGSQRIDAVARDNGVDVDSYSRRVYIFPPGSSCGDHGWGSAGGNPSTVFLSNPSLFSLIHEIGHNFGLPDAKSISCGDKAIDNYDNCNVVNYGDPYGPMGYNKKFHHCAFYKSWLDWIPSSNVQEVTSSGEYTVYPLEVLGLNTQILKINKPDTVQHYYLEFRKPLGYDQDLPQGATEGVLIRIGFFKPFFEGLKIYQYPESYLIDTTPNSLDGFLDAALSNGQTFYDEINNIRVTQLDYNSDFATVFIELDENRCLPSNPSIQVSPTTQTGEPGQTLSFTISVTNNDNSNCSPAQFTLRNDRFNLPGWNYSFSPASFTLAPGATQSATYDVTSSVDAVNSTYYVGIKVEDVNNSYHTSLASVTYAVETGLAGDLNEDGKVNFADALIVFSNWIFGSDSRADVNEDGKINSVDFGAVLRDWMP